jgi:hypothetical protein
MLSINIKPLMIWAASLLSIGCCKVCYILMYDLSTLVVLQFEPTDVNLLIFVIVENIVAPILSIIATLLLFRFLYTAANKSFT